MAEWSPIWGGDGPVNYYKSQHAISKGEGFNHPHPKKGYTTENGPTAAPGKNASKMQLEQFWENAPGAASMDNCATYPNRGQH